MLLLDPTGKVIDNMIVEDIYTSKILLTEVYTPSGDYIGTNLNDALCFLARKYEFLCTNFLELRQENTVLKQRIDELTERELVYKKAILIGGKNNG
jgi:hypothetical protein